tara:strand:+ start:1047 stop:1430 length:384 start_codon:yes stop_codon:yes gene_type:complete
MKNEILDVLNIALDITDSTFRDFEFEELMQVYLNLLEELDSSEIDHTLDLPSGEVRIISSDHIDQLWTDSLIDQIKDCYDLDSIPDFVAIDWNETADNCKIDGMGHHFSSYDGGEHNTTNFYIFRTN